jgi:hypothetical protein
VLPVAEEDIAELGDLSGKQAKDDRQLQKLLNGHHAPR